LCERCAHPRHWGHPRLF